MALFKVFRGNEADLPAKMTDGWAYFCTDTSNLFIDYEDGSVLKRAQLNAKDAETLAGASLSTLQTIFSSISHTHTMKDISDLQDTFDNIQNDLDNLEGNINDLAESMSYKILPITQEEYDALAIPDSNTLYIIEV